jgi:hypothetical protein
MCKNTTLQHHGKWRNKINSTVGQYKHDQHQCLFGAKFCNLVTKKRVDKSNKGILGNFLKTFSISWGKKKVARFRHCVLETHQN